MERVNNCRIYFVILAYDTTYPDRLVSYNGKSISYNALGCVSSYDGSSYSWSKGRLSAIFSGKPIGALPYKNCTFSYDGYGRRISKSYTYDSKSTTTFNSAYSYNTTYTYDHSGRLIREYCVETSISEGNSLTHELIYLYDESGIIGVMYAYDGASLLPYFYQKNMQGDVIAIYAQDGTKVVEYYYDAFGNCTVTNSTNGTLARYNPIRYRGYYYDRETKLYYLNSRYYNPEWRRFISPDAAAYLDPESVNGLNLYAYCGNDPVNFVDPSGNSPFLIALSLIATAGLITTGIGVAANNSLVTAIGLSAVAIPAMISGGLSLSLLTPVGISVGATTIAAGAGTALFASAEYQEYFTGDNWMLDSGMTEGWYNGLMLATASIATLGTFASSVAYSLSINKITSIGKIKGVRANEGYPGFRFIDKSGTFRSLELHPSHYNHGVHLQLNNWWLNKSGYVGQYYRAFSKHLEIFRFWKGWF